MKTLGLVGGSDVQSVTKYMLEIDRRIKEELNENKHIQSIVQTIDVAKDDKNYVKELVYSIDNLKSAGAQIGILTQEASHEYLSDIQRNVSMSMIDIGEAVAKQLKAKNINKVMLLGYREMMQSDYYITTFNRHGITVAQPSIEVINQIHDCLSSSKIDRIKLSSIIEVYRMRGISGVVVTTDVPIKLRNLSVEVINSFDAHVTEIIEKIN